MAILTKDQFLEFQLTRPVWGVTTYYKTNQAYRSDFNSHAPCGA